MTEGAIAKLCVHTCIHDATVQLCRSTLKRFLRLKQSKTHLDGEEGLWADHLFDLLHHLPVGDGFAWCLQLRKLGTDVDLGHRLEEQALRFIQLYGLCGVSAH